MESEARYTYVGPAVLVLVAALVNAVVWLKDVGRKGDFSYYAINFERQSLDGLQVGADVNLRGIKVGRVEDYALSAEKFNRVRVVVRVDGRVPVRSNTVAVVTRNFVTGIAAITLVTPVPGGVERGLVPVLWAQPVYLWGKVGVETIVGKLVLKKQVPDRIRMDLVRVSKENLGTWARQLGEWGFTGVPAEYQQLK